MARMSWLSDFPHCLAFLAPLEVLQLGPNRLLGGRPQAAIDVGIHPRHDLARRTVPCRERGSNLIQPFQPMPAIKGQPRDRIVDDWPVTREQFRHVLGRDQRLQQIERSEVRRKVAVRISDHRRTTAQHHVAGDAAG